MNKDALGLQPQVSTSRPGEVSFFHQILYYFQKRGFEVSRRIAERMGIRTRVVRTTFIYLTFVTLGFGFARSRHGSRGSERCFRSRLDHFCHSEKVSKSFFAEDRGDLKLEYDEGRGNYKISLARTGKS